MNRNRRKQKKKTIYDISADVAVNGNLNHAFSVSGF